MLLNDQTYQKVIIVQWPYQFSIEQLCWACRLVIINDGGGVSRRWPSFDPWSNDKRAEEETHISIYKLFHTIDD